MIEEKISDFCKSLSGVGRILDDPEYHVWGCSPIYGPDGKVHIFYSRWKNEAAHQGWISCSEIAHAVADDPAGPYTTVDVAITGRGGGWWDSMTCHNPSIHKIDGKYVLFYMGNSDSTAATKRAGMAISDSLYGPWERCEKPIVEPDPDPKAWNSMITSNPAFVRHPNGEYWLFYKSWSIADREKDIRENCWQHTYRRYGLAIARSLKGPWIKQKGSIMDLRNVVKDAQSEDAYVWVEGGKFKMLMRDMGYWNHQYGLYFESVDGIDWGEPQIGYLQARHYLNEPPTGNKLDDRFERPQLLIRDGKPEYLFAAIRGGKYKTSSVAVLKISDGK